jgi:electron transfer flavoprotein-quinone oxidoreductase
MAKITTLSCDIETYSSIDLAKCGVYRYSQSPDFELLLFGYSVDDGEVQVIDLACGEKIPPVIVSALSDPTITKWAFNAQFERICLSRFLGFPTGTYLDPDGWHCTMVWSATLGLPLSLEGAGAVLGLEKQKLQEGKNLIKYFCVPCAANKANGGRRRNLPQHDMEKWKLFKAYNKRDVETEIGIQEKLSKFPVPDTEWDNYRLDQSINDRGIALDMDFVRQAIRCDEITKTKLRGLMQNLIIENGRVEGVYAGGDELRSQVVIACDGVLSLMAEKAGLRKPGSARQYGVGFKEVIELDSALINERFGLEGDEGAARLFMGEVTKGKFGGGFLYTNKESISLGIVVGIHDLMEGAPAIQAPVLLDEFKQRPEIARLIKGGETVEYSAHVIPEGGLKALTKLYGEGILVAGDAAGFSLNIGVTVRGMEYAMASGYYAAQAVIQAKAREDFSAASLASYESMLNESFVMQDFKNFSAAPEALDNHRIYTHYPELLGNIMRDMYSIPPGSKERLYPTAKKYLGTGELWAMFKDLRKVMKI